MAKSKKPAGEQPDEIDHTALAAPDPEPEALTPAQLVEEAERALLNVEAVDDLIAVCPVELDYRLRVTAERLEEHARRLRAEWRRRRGE